MCPQYFHKKGETNCLEQTSTKNFTKKQTRMWILILKYFFGGMLCELGGLKNGQRIKICLSIYISGGSFSTSRNTLGILQ